MLFDHVHFRKTYRSDILLPPSKYFSEQILVVLARNSLNMLVIVPEGTQECGLIWTFVRAGLR